MRYLIILKMYVFLHELNSSIYATKVMNKMFTNSNSIDGNAEITSVRRYDRDSNIGHPHPLCVCEFSMAYLSFFYKEIINKIIHIYYYKLTFRLIIYITTLNWNFR
jgi:hypothetical protein